MTPTLESQRSALYSLLGELPPRNRPISILDQAEEARDKYILQTLLLDLNGNEPVPAYFIKPLDAVGRLPTILYNHSHGGRYEIGKEEFLAGIPTLQNPPYAEVVAELGCAGLCIDTWMFGNRQGPSESHLFKRMLWNGQVLWGMMVYDAIRAVDYLVSRPDVDADRLGTLGMSMGSTLSWWLAALEPRISVCIDLCCLTDYQALLETNGLELHGLYYYVPGLLKHFTTAQINALIAPRLHLSLAGNRDPLTPPQGLDRVDAELKQVYQDWGAPEAWSLLRSDTGHSEEPWMRLAVVRYLQNWLKKFEGNQEGRDRSDG